MVNQWIEKYYCEGEINDILSKQELWLNFKDTKQLQDSERLAFFSPWQHDRPGSLRESTTHEKKA